MPVLTRFYGMVVKMYLRGKEHDPPHIHFLYGEHNGVIELNTVALIEGDLPTKALSMALEWTKAHQSELLEMWQTQQFRKLPPLE